MSSVAQIAVLRGLIWAVLLYFAIRHRSWPSVIVVLGSWIVLALLAKGLLVESGVVAVGTAALIVYLLIDRLQQDPSHVKHVLASQLHDARDELHDCHADRASWEARAVAYKRLLDKHDIHS